MVNKKTEVTIHSSAAEYLTYVASIGDQADSFEMRYEDENIWLTQKMMAELYNVSVSAINQHLKKIFEDGELLEEAVIKKYLITAADGKSYCTKHYNLQAIIAVGFKVNNERAVRFRKWSGQIVKDYTIQGWTMDKERLKKGHMFTDEYFERQLQNIREIRLSERKFYQKITDLYATAFDYDKDAMTTRRFFQTVQNKMHWAVHRHTAAELIVERADAEKEYMGLTTWTSAPDGKIVKSDVSIAKNYLNDKEMSYMERIVSLYLDYAELQAERKIPMSMEDWAKRLDGFLEFNGNEILTGAGKVSAEQAKLYAETEFEKYRIVQDRMFVSDYDRFLLEIEEQKCSMIAHKRESDGREQSWSEHSRNVSKLCFWAAEKLGLGILAKLTGLLHDFGKGTVDFLSFLRGTGDKHPNHAGLGALYVHRHWWMPAKTVKERQTAQLIALCIYGHHAGLPDCLNDSGNSPYLNGLEEQSDGYYMEAMGNFYSEIASAEELDELFTEACGELEKFGLDKYSFDWGMLARLLLSVLIDSDRWDSACFDYDANPFETFQNDQPDWKKLLLELETFLGSFPQKGKLAEIRWNISEWCRDAGELKPGIYTLSVPTGGGKTYSSLRFALAQAKKYGQRRIFYFIPMNTILDQNSKDIRDALSDYPSILEHHSNVVLEDEEEEKKYRRLTERWDSDIILTSLVQFLDSLFQNGNSKARRMYRLVDSVLIFDEIQALPKRCRELFEKAIQFLVRYCNCTALLCTATQPELNLEAKELVPDVDALYRKLKRVTYIPQLEVRRYQEAAIDIVEFIRDKKSVLTIVNTKDAAWNVFKGILEQLEILNYGLVEIKQGLSDEALEEYARDCGENKVLCVHLSTLMCPEHRTEIVRWVKAWLEAEKLVCCVSTALIEAGINVSFPIVIRSLAGIPSVVQAAGRCNRNCEADRGYVYLWNLAEERLGRLPDIQKGKEISMSLFSSIGDIDEIGTPQMIKKYFEKEEVYTQKVEKYPYKEWNSDLVTMFSTNRECRNVAEDLQDNPLPNLSKRLSQSFRTAGSAFRVIDQKTKSVIVPYGKGKELIEKLAGRHPLSEEIKYLKKAQRYSVDLFEQIFERLGREGALISLGDTGAVVLKEEYYNAWAGVSITPREMVDLIM